MDKLLEILGLAKKSALDAKRKEYTDLLSDPKYHIIDDLASLRTQHKDLELQIKANKVSLEEIKDKGITDVEIEISNKKYQLRKKLSEETSNEKQKLDELKNEIKDQQAKLSEIKSNIEIEGELSLITPVAQNIEGVGSEDIKIKIDHNKEDQKAMIRSRDAWTAFDHHTLNGSLAAGKSMQKRLAKFLMTAFNAEIDNIIALVKKNSLYSSHKKIEKWFEKINKLGEEHFIVIERDFLKLRLEELKIVIEYHLQREFEKEEARYISESIREEKRVQKEIELFVKAREKEEKDYQASIDKANRELEISSDAEVTRLKELITTLEIKLERSHKEKERAMSLAQLTRSGHVYIISNTGSFGEGIYKIGMTRRLDPMDRVKELGDASVPFYFDVHGIIHSEDAPGLERKLHKRFEKHRVNKENVRREFFRVSLDDIEKAISEEHSDVSLDRTIHQKPIQKTTYKAAD